jgi:hypothetical protein
LARALRVRRRISTGNEHPGEVRIDALQLAFEDENVATMAAGVASPTGICRQP